MNPVLALSRLPQWINYFLLPGKPIRLYPLAITEGYSPSLDLNGQNALSWVQHKKIRFSLTAVLLARSQPTIGIKHRIIII